jgi:transposase
MISLSAATRVFVVTGPTDLRKSFNGLYAIVSQQLRQDPTSGHVFVFCNRARTRIKLLLWDGSGFWICAKRLERGKFGWPWPQGEDAPVISHEALSLLLGGIDLAQTRSRKWFRKSAA